MEKLANGIVDGLKNQPILLAVAVLNIASIAAIVYLVKGIAADSAKRFEQVIALCLQAGGA